MARKFVLELVFKNVYNVHMAKRGGQPGNTNALKHGFYSRQFTIKEKHMLAANEEQLKDLSSEIALLRVVINRVFALSVNAEFEKLVNVASVISQAVLRLASVLRVQHLLTSESGGSPLFDLLAKLGEEDENA